MRKELRQAGIVEMVERSGYLSVADAAAALSVTMQTIRRDFDELIGVGAIIRHHGGATPNPAGKVASYATRRSYLSEAKRSIARRLIELIPAGSTIFIETGTTLEALASDLPKLRLARVVTNNANLALTLSRHRAWPVEVPHGAVRASDGAIVGERANASLAEYRFDLALIGAAALAHDGAILDDDTADVAIARTALAASRDGILAVDATKFRHIAPLRIAHLADLAALVTDRMPPPGIREAAARGKTSLHIAHQAEPPDAAPRRPPRTRAIAS